MTYVAQCRACGSLVLVVPHTAGQKCAKCGAQLPADVYVAVYYALREIADAIAEGEA